MTLSYGLRYMNNPELADDQKITYTSSVKTVVVIEKTS